jgi:hypothetical protein
MGDFFGKYRGQIQILQGVSEQKKSNIEGGMANMGGRLEIYFLTKDTIVA